MLIICTIRVPDRSVWVSDSQQPFVEHPDMSPDVLYLKEKQPLVIPCRVTHPNVTTTLVKVSAIKPCLLICSASFELGVSASAHAHHHCPITPRHIYCSSSLVPAFFPSGTRVCTLHAVPHFSLSRSFATLFLCLGSHCTVACVCLFVCVRWRICVKVCADMFVRVGARVLSEGESGQSH